jgi:hypothetical protein
MRASRANEVLDRSNEVPPKVSNFILNLTQTYDNLKKQRGGPALSYDRPSVFYRRISLRGPSPKVDPQKELLSSPLLISSSFENSLFRLRTLFGHHFTFGKNTRKDGVIKLLVFRDEIQLQGSLPTKVVSVGGGLNAKALMKPANQTTVCMCCLSMHQQGQNIYSRTRLTD